MNTQIENKWRIFEIEKSPTNLCVKIFLFRDFYLIKILMNILVESTKRSVCLSVNTHAILLLLAAVL